MNFNYSDSNYYRSQFGFPRVGSPLRMRGYEPQNSYYPETRYYPTETDDQSTYYLSLQNSELSNSLYEERRQNRDLTGQLNFKISEVEEIGTKIKKKTDDLDSLKIRYEQSEKIRQEQSKLINNMQKEIENIKKKLEEKEQELSPNDDFKSNTSSKNEPKPQAKTGGSKPGFLQNLKNSSTSNSKPAKK